MTIAYVNGEWTPIAQAVIPMEDRAHQFADGVYEVIAFFNHTFLDAEPHLQRLQRSCDELGIDNPHTKAEWRTILSTLIEKNDFEHGGVYLQISRGTQTRNHIYQPQLKSNVSLSIFGQKTPNRELTEQGAKVITYPDLRWKRCDIKTTGLLGSVMAKQAAHKANAREAILFKENGEVTEASVSNFFIVKDNSVRTHPATNEILNGVARQVTISLANKLGIIVEEMAFTKAEMLDADEAFLTGTTTNILPVIKVDDTPIATGKPGPITWKLLEAFTDHIKAQTGYTLWS